MVVVVIGGSGSGKSEFAENTAVRLNQIIFNQETKQNKNTIQNKDTRQNKNLIYIATMQPFDEEGKRRVERHQNMRKDKNFDTLECYTGIKNLSIPIKTTILLECMSNLVANEMFSEAGAKNKTFDAIKQGMEHLMEQSEHLIIVTNNVFEDGVEYDKETDEYLKTLGKVNQWISQLADQVIEVVHGIPILMKKEASSQKQD